MIKAVETYLAVRRAVGFTLSNTECLLRSFARFTIDQKQTHIRTATAIEWASQARSVAQRHKVVTVHQRQRIMWSCPQCNGSMLILERMNASQLRFRAPPNVNLTAA